MEEAVKLVRLARYALYRSRMEERDGRNATAWRNVFHQLIGILRGYLAGEIPPERLVILWRILSKLVKKYYNLSIWIDNPSISAKIKLSPSTTSIRGDAGKKGEKGGKGNWVTIHGTHVLIGEGGKIEKGPSNLQGQSVKSGTTRSGTSGTGGGGRAEPKRPENEQEVLKQFKRYEPGTKTEAEKLAQVNPNAWKNNCQRCVVAYELIERGYDVTVKPFSPTDPLGDIGAKAFKVLDPPHLDPDFHFIYEKSSFQDSVNKYFEEWGDSARVMVRVMWDHKDSKSNNVPAHGFIAKRVKGKVVYLDPQTNKIRDIKETLRRSTDKFPPWILRIDNKEFSDLVMYAAQNRMENAK